MLPRAPVFVCNSRPRIQTYFTSQKQRKIVVHIQLIPAHPVNYDKFFLNSDSLRQRCILRGLHLGGRNVCFMSRANWKFYQHEHSVYIIYSEESKMMELEKKIVGVREKVTGNVHS